MEVQAQIYEGLYSYKYLTRPYELEPSLAKALPRISDDGLTYTIDLKTGVLFHDDVCFANGKGREVTAQDFVYSFKRMTDQEQQANSFWMFQDRIAGFDAFEQRMARREHAPFDWDGDVEGLKAIGPHQLQIRLLRPYPQLLSILATEQAAVVPRECAEHYKEDFGSHAVGTGPFVLKEWIRGETVVLSKNQNYRDSRFPTEASPEYKDMLGDAGKKVPFLDSLVYHVYEDDQAMWTKFLDGDLDMTQVPTHMHKTVFDGDQVLRETFASKGIQNLRLPLLDLIYRGFNMQDPVVGVGKGAKYLRQAISLALDAQAINEKFYNDTCVLFDGPIPPGLDAFKPGITSPYRGPNLDKAKALMVKAGYPKGDGLPTLTFHTSNGGSSAIQAELLAEALAAIGIKLKVNSASYAELSKLLKDGQAQMFGLAWGADYPDAETFLQLYFGPNRAPGSNNFSYTNPTFDALYERARLLQPSKERTALYEEMREILIEDIPSFGHMARSRFYLWHGRLQNALPSETFHGWRKYLNLRVTTPK